MAPLQPLPKPAETPAEAPAPALATPVLAHQERPTAGDPESAALQPLVLRTCLALHAMACSLAALDTVLQKLEVMEPKADQHAELVRGTAETIAQVIALLRREGPPLLHRAQALRMRLRLHGFAGGPSTGNALRTLHADLDGLAAFRPAPAARTVAYWSPHIRRARSNTLIMLSEFDRHARQIAEQLKGHPAEGATVLPFETPKPG